MLQTILGVCRSNKVQTSPRKKVEHSEYILHGGDNSALKVGGPTVITRSAKAKFVQSMEGNEPLIEPEMFP